MPSNSYLSYLPDRLLSSSELPEFSSLEQARVQRHKAKMQVQPREDQTEVTHPAETAFTEKCGVAGAPEHLASDLEGGFQGLQLPSGRMRIFRALEHRNGVDGVGQW